MYQYPYYTSKVLTDAVFVKYGGHTGTSTPDQREAAFLLAEEQMTEYLNSFLVPTIITGTYFWTGHNPVILDTGHVLAIKKLTIYSIDWSNGCSVDSVSGCYGGRNYEYGLVDIGYYMNCGGCNTGVGYPPYNIEVIYESGLNSGTVTQPSVLAALTLAAQIHLNEMDVSLSNEGTADIGIQKFSNQQYSEERVKLGNTVFGNSPMANRVARLVRKYRCRPGVGFR